MRLALFLCASEYCAAGQAGQSFRLACPCGQETEGLKTPGY